MRRGRQTEIKDRSLVGIIKCRGRIGERGCFDVLFTERQLEAPV